MSEQQLLKPQVCNLVVRKELEVFYGHNVQFNKKYPARLESSGDRRWGFQDDAFPFDCPETTDGIFVAQVREDQSGVIMILDPKGNYKYEFQGGLVKSVTESGVVTLRPSTKLCLT